MATIKVATPAEKERIISVMVLAFCGDPVVRWVWSDPQRYLESFPLFVNAFGGKAFSTGSAYYLDDFSGAALWLPPKVHFDEAAVGSALESTMPKEIQADGFAVFDQMAKFHPAEPHWYLPVLGVDPARHSMGLGSILMGHVLAICDRDNISAYLESSNPKNIPFYKRHGFEVLGTIQAGKERSIFPMLRKPQG